MKASNLSEAQKAFFMKQGEDGTPVAEICYRTFCGQRRRQLWQRIG